MDSANKSRNNKSIKHQTVHRQRNIVNSSIRIASQKCVRGVGFIARTIATNLPHSQHIDDKSTQINSCVLPTNSRALSSWIVFDIIFRGFTSFDIHIYIFDTIVCQLIKCFIPCVPNQSKAHWIYCKQHSIREQFWVSTISNDST